MKFQFHSSIQYLWNKLLPFGNDFPVESEVHQQFHHQNQGSGVFKHVEWFKEVLRSQSIMYGPFQFPMERAKEVKPILFLYTIVLF